MLILTIYDKFTLLYSFSNLPYIKNVCWCAATEYFSGRLVGLSASAWKIFVNSTLSMNRVF